MAATLTARGLAAGHGERTLFEGLDLVVAPGDRVGLVGANGAGKSTLLRLLAGAEPPRVGAVRVDPAGAVVGLLPQEHARVPGETVGGYLARRTGTAGAQLRLDVATEALASGAAGSDDEYAAALEHWLALGAADLEDRIPEALADVGLAIPIGTPMKALSGGQAARAALAVLLLARYDVYLLDEPTNDLDLAGLERLERLVTGLRAGSVVVSHDREFLARVVDTVVELDAAQHVVRIHQGGYDAYLRERSVAKRREREAYEDYAATRESLEERARRQRAWMDKGVRNARRKQPDNDKAGKAFRTETSEKQAAKARQTERAIERLEVVEEPRREWELRMTIATAPRAGAVVATLRGAVVRRGDFVLGPLSAQVDWADRVGITGANGSGKSTLLGALLGRLPVESGSAGLGPGVVVGEVDQARAAFAGEAPLLDAFRTGAPDLEPADVRTLLAKYGLGAAHVLRPAASLSAGERTRAGLALLQARGVNLLALDEPTNHLDLPAIEQLEQALDGYPGTLLLVTHDRRMLEAVRLTRRWRVEAGGVREE